jgi:Xaa-Pro dipeptidase
MDLSAIQSVLRDRKIDGWLFYDHHHRDAIAYGVLGLSEKLHVTRRWFYLVPASGEPVKLVHRIESKHLDSLPGKKFEYSAWQEQHQHLKSMLAPYKTLAMQYSPNNSVFLIGLVDAGTIELIRSFGHEVVSSGDLVSIFEATWSEEQIATHFFAGKAIDRIMQESFQEIGRRVRNGGTNEFEIQQWITEAFRREELFYDDPAVVGVNENSANPHYSPSKDSAKPIREGDFVLLDMWGKKKLPHAVYYDITWTGVVGTPTEKHNQIFQVVKSARDAAFQKVKSTLDSKKKLAGWEVDEVTRRSISDAGFGKYFIHRTGHSIGPEVHGNGANIDNLETKDDREILPNTCFSIEPGVYLEDFGVRSEFDVLVRKGSAEITGQVQQELVRI